MSNLLSSPTIINNTIEVIKEGGLPGRDGYTPYIDEKTKHWFINGVDTGYSVLGNDVKIIENFINLPPAGTSGVLYVVTETYEIYIWEQKEIKYKKITGMPTIELISCGNSTI